MGTIRIRVLAYEGIAVWELPMKDSELEQRMEAPGGSVMIQIAEVLQPEGLHMLSGQTVNADELNYLAKRLGDFSQAEYMTFFAAAQISKAADVGTLINLSFNLERYTVVQDVTKLAAIGKMHYMNKRGGISKAERETVDFARIGMDLLTSGNGIPTDYGILFENYDIPTRTLYDGTVFPYWSWREDEVAAIEISYNGRAEYLYLPEESITIDKALKRLGAQSLEDCELDIESISDIRKSWQSHLEAALENGGLYEANTLAEVLARKNLDQYKLMLAAEYAEVVDSHSIKKLADHLDNFTVIKGAETNADVGKYIVQHEFGYKAGVRLADYVDYSKLGEDIMQERDGEFLGGAFVCMEDGCSYEQIMGCKSPDMILGGM